MLPDDPDAVARLFYLIVLLLALSSYFLFGRSQALGRTLQQALTWALIFAMAVIAYSFRDTLRGALFPGAAIQVSRDAIELGRARDGHFYATLDVNGAPIRFMVDTGATDVVLSARDAARAGIDTTRLTFAGRAMTANGEVRTARVRLDSVGFGGVTETGVTASVSSGALDTSLLGMSYLDRFDRIEISGDRMLLAR